MTDPTDLKSAVRDALREEHDRQAEEDRVTPLERISRGYDEIRVEREKAEREAAA